MLRVLWGTRKEPLSGFMYRRWSLEWERNGLTFIRAKEPLLNDNVWRMPHRNPYSLRGGRCLPVIG